MIDELLKSIPEKGYSGDMNTTSRRFKKDLYEFFNKPEFKHKVALEIGCYFCHTSVVLSYIFDTVYALQEVDRPEAKEFALSQGRQNIVLVIHDMYGGQDIPIERADVILIDAMHTYDAVKSDVRSALKLKSDRKKYFVFDDYGAGPDVKTAIDEMCNSGSLVKVMTIGYKKGEPWGLIPYPLLDDEGIICREI